MHEAIQEFEKGNGKGMSLNEKCQERENNVFICRGRVRIIDSKCLNDHMCGPLSWLSFGPMSISHRYLKGKRQTYPWLVAPRCPLSQFIYCPSRQIIED